MIDLLMRIADKIVLGLAVVVLAWAIYAGITDMKDFRSESAQAIRAAARLQQVIGQNDEVWPAPPNDPKLASEMVLGNWKNAPSTNAFHGYDFGM